MKLSVVTLEDAATLATVHAQGFASPWDEGAFREVLSGPGVFGFLAMDGPEALGLAVCRNAADELEILTITVAPAARRRGVAKTMMAAALAAARAAGAGQALLEVGADNPDAVELYLRLGFQRAGVRKAYYDRGAAGRADALVMRLDLVASDH